MRMETALAKKTGDVFCQSQKFGRHSLVRVTVEGRKSRVEGKAFPGSRRSSLVSRLTVRPDFVFRQVRLALFVDGCFWHGCPRHATKPANNRAFWKKKLAGNKTRDRVVNRTLRRAGWKVVRIWEHALPRLKAKGQRLKVGNERLKGRVKGFASRGGEHRTSNIEHPPSNGRQKGEPSGLVKQIQRALDVINAVR